jgi:hypothetical protein
MSDDTRACVRDPEDGQRVIAHVRKYYRTDGVLGGYTCDADAIRLVLTYSQHFDDDEIAAWPEDEHIMMPIGTSLYDWILDYAKGKGLAYKVIAVRMRNTAVVTWEHYGDFDVGKLTEGGWFGWERKGKLIDKECVPSCEACPRL